MEDKKHTSITDYATQEDGSVVIDTESYYEELASRKRDVLKHTKTSNATFLADLMECASAVRRGDTKDLWVHIRSSEAGPYLIDTRWTVYKEDLKRR